MNSSTSLFYMGEMKTTFTEKIEKKTTETKNKKKLKEAKKNLESE